MMEPGSRAPLGPVCHADGVNFAIWAEAAERVELCLYDERGRATGRYDLPARSDGVWHGFLPGCAEGQRYGYRMHGPYAPQSGHRFNPNKLLIDPYARLLAGEFCWEAAVFDYSSRGGEPTLNTADSAAFVPKSVVTAVNVPGPAGPRIPWAETVIYEANVRGYT
ncbi:MAG: glycogen debranching enzyme GlgX, partial [Gammaproteobacteria bacterium]|nr:glycogen debranching enzyme GlgX [Gammaproteobacteria bacterium]